MDNMKTKKPKKASNMVNDLTDANAKSVSNIGVTTNTNGNFTWTTTGETVTVNPNDEVSDKEREESSQFQKLVERYMKCEKRTLAEMLAMRDIDDDPYKGRNFNEELQKLLNDPSTFRVPIDPVPPIQPNTPYPDYGAYCFLAPGHRCPRGNTMYLGKCDGCPYTYQMWPTITWKNDNSDGNPNRGTYATCSCTYQKPCGKDNTEH